ncbi:DUF2946 family protein [Commensalibacter nepenthis]|uniref:DUF2946 domain-containing protein n=1 Tax=Commensalibacter nepenthis TaxID=3043872 RepID=A0ABT6Q7I9_9PROT|nr:DUF2946 family protein [Commensalibacter sp. TBRC 10068]MDI2112856.1 hypothetical protein [Commensalibacter sp. TBRC 10068]
MQPFNLHINWIQNRNKIQHSGFLYMIYVVLTLFILQLLISPLTFSNWWHCPMMMGETASSMTSMDMEDCMHMEHMQQSKETKQDHHQKSQHGMVLCPLCTSFALPTPLLSGNPELPALSVVLIAFQIKAYFSQAPPTPLTKSNPPRAPPSFDSDTASL